MRTLLRSEKREVAVDTESAFTVIGEKINPTGRKKLAEALVNRDYEYICNIARQQVAGGADVLDVNVGAPGIDEVTVLADVARRVAQTVDVPLCLDSANREALAAALAVLPGKPLINSVNGEEASLNRILPVVKEYGAAVIALTMDDDGIPTTVDRRLAVAHKIMERAASLGIPAEDVIIDTLVLTVGADSKAASVTLKTVERIRQELGVNISLGASNVSFGMPERHTINQAFLVLAIAAGATCAITDPVKLALTIRAADLLRGRDDRGRRYLGYWRTQQAMQPAQWTT
jgi:5-methyltetrahydrofolate--homocysteine methyltransferase